MQNSSWFALDKMLTMELLYIVPFTEVFVWRLFTNIYIFRFVSHVRIKKDMSVWDSLPVFYRCFPNQGMMTLLIILFCFQSYRMKLLLVVVAVAFSSGAFVDAVCNHPPSLWCTSGEIAKQCGVGPIYLSVPWSHMTWSHMICEISSVPNHVTDQTKKNLN